MPLPAPASIVSSFVSGVFAEHQRKQDERIAIECGWPIVIDFIKSCEVKPVPGAALREKLMKEGVVSDDHLAAKVIHWLSENGYLLRSRRTGQSFDYDLAKEGAVFLEEVAEQAAHLPDNESGRDHLLPLKAQWAGEQGVVRRGTVVAFIPPGVDCSGFFDTLPGERHPVRLAVRDKPAYLIHYKGKVTFKHPSDIEPLSHYNEDETTVGEGGVIVAKRYGSKQVDSKPMSPQAKNGPVTAASINGKSFIEALDYCKNVKCLPSNPIVMALLARAEKEIGFYEVQRNGISMLLRTKP